MNNLNHCPYHLSNLVVQKRRPLELKANQFNRLRVFRTRDLESLGVHVDLLVCTEMQHMSSRRVLLGRGVFRKVVELLDAKEVLGEDRVCSLDELRTGTESVQAVDEVRVGREMAVIAGQVTEFELK